MLDAQQAVNSTEEIGDSEVLTTHPDLTRTINAFPPVEVQTLNFRRALAIAGGLAGRGMIKVDFNDPDYGRNWASLVTAIQEELNSLEVRW